MKQKIIAVWGSSGSGKSLLSVALAHVLTAKGKNVLVMSADRMTPMLGIYLPGQQFRPENSLGKLLTEGVNKDTIRGKLHIHPGNDRLAFAALVQQDSVMQYQAGFDAGSIASLFFFLQSQELAEIVLVDCTCNLLTDALSFYAMEHADAAIRVLSPDNAGTVFLAAQDALIKGGSFHAERHLTVYNNYFEYTPIQQLQQDYEVAIAFPHSDEAYGQYWAGEAVGKHLHERAGYLFETQLKKLTGQVMGDG